MSHNAPLSDPRADLAQRRAVWEAVSTFFLDTEKADGDCRFIASVLAESPYTIEQLERILWEEVYPVCIWNLRCVAGEWTAFDLDGLQRAILANQWKRWHRWPWFQRGRWMVADHWAKVKRHLEEERERRGNGVNRAR